MPCEGCLSVEGKKRHTDRSRIGRIQYHSSMRTDAPSNSLSSNNSSEKIRVIVVDDDPFVLQALRAYLSEAQEIEVLSTFGSATDAFNFLQNYRVDVLITDVRMPGMDGLQLLTKVKQGIPGVAVIVLTSFDDDEAMRTALDRKANGFLLKDSSAEEVIRAVIAAHNGGTTISPATTSRLVSQYLRPVPSSRPGVTEAELAVLDFLCEGYSNAEIADRLFISEATVKSHVSHLMKKYGVSSRLKLVVATHQER